MAKTTETTDQATGPSPVEFPYNKGPFLDWLAFSIPYTSDWMSWVSKMFGSLRENPYGFSGYPVSATAETGALIGWHPEKVKQKVHVVLSSRALASCRIDKGLTADSIIEAAKDRGATFTRIDVAIDDYGLNWHDEGATSRRLLLSPDKCFRHLRRGYVTSRFRGFQRIEGREKAGQEQVNPDTGESIFGYYARIQTGKIHGKQLGETVYIGSPSSDVRCRIYDKAAQTGMEFPWMRFEIVFRKKRAEALAENLPDVNVPGLILHYVDFKERSGAQRIDRRPSASWWIAFLQTIDKKKLTLPKQTPGLEEIDEWIHKQVSGALWLLYEAYGWDKVDEIMQDGKDKFNRNKRYQNLLDRTKTV